MRISTANAFDTGIDTLHAPPGRAGRGAGAADQRQARQPRQRRPGRRGARRAGAGEHRPHRAEPARASRRARSLMTQTESALGDAGDLLQRARELLVAAGNASYSDAERPASPTSCARCASSCSPSPTERRRRHLPVRRPGRDRRSPSSTRPAACSTRGHRRQTRDRGRHRPAADDRRPAPPGCSARTGNGVFVTQRRRRPCRTPSIDSGRVTDPSALTGSDYTLQFSVAAGVTTYAVLQRRRCRPRVTAAPYVLGPGDRRSTA